MQLLPSDGPHRMKQYRIGLLSWGAPQLGERARFGLLVRPPAEELGAVAEASAGEVVVADLADQDRIERLPLRRAPLGPAARSSRRLAGEAAASSVGLQDRLQLFLFLGGEA